MRVCAVGYFFEDIGHGHPVEWRSTALVALTVTLQLRFNIHLCESFHFSFSSCTLSSFPVFQESEVNRIRSGFTCAKSSFPRRITIISRQTMTNKRESLATILAQLVQLSDSWEIFYRIVNIYAQSHVYLEQWKSIRIDVKLLENIIATVRRYEGGFQLKGLGVWLLDMLLYHVNDVDGLNALGSPKTIDAMLRIFLEHPSHCKCLGYLLGCIKLKLVTFGQICDNGKICC
jgi:hypothetical protein